MHFTGPAVPWLGRQHQAGQRILGVELADEAIRLADLPAGIPPEALDLLDAAVEIPMVGHGASLNVAVAGSLVLYRPHPVSRS